MSGHLPERFDPVDFADKLRSLVGEIPLRRLDRVCDSLFDLEGVVSIQLGLHRDHHVPLIQGELSVRLVLECQICMKPMPFDLDVKVLLGVVQTLEQADRLPEGVEPLMPDEEGMVVLSDLVQDEILLALPVIPQHEHCGDLPAESVPAEAPRKRQDNPFAVLAALKK